MRTCLTGCGRDEGSGKKGRGDFEQATGRRRRRRRPGLETGGEPACVAPRASRITTALHQLYHDYVRLLRDFFIFTRGSLETDPREPTASWPRKTSCWTLYPADWSSRRG